MAIVAALGKMEEGRHSELDRLSGIPNTSIVAERCYLIYGYPELEAGNRARRMNELAMKPRKANPRPPTQAAAPQPEIPAPNTGYGLQRRS